MYSDSVRVSGSTGQAQDGCRSNGQCDAQAERGAGRCAFSGKKEAKDMEERGLVQTFATRLTDSQAERLTRLAERAGTTRSAVLRLLVARATEADVTTKEKHDDRRH